MRDDDYASFSTVISAAVVLLYRCLMTLTYVIDDSARPVLGDVLIAERVGRFVNGFLHSQQALPYQFVGYGLGVTSLPQSGRFQSEHNPSRPATSRGQCSGRNRFARMNFPLNLSAQRLLGNLEIVACL